MLHTDTHIKIFRSWFVYLRYIFDEFTLLCLCISLCEFCLEYFLSLLILHFPFGKQVLVYRVDAGKRIPRRDSMLRL